MRLTLALVLLLTAVGEASADCAWVLWAQRKPRAEPTPVTGVPSHADCEKWRQASQAQDPQMEKVLFFCLPDTIDPRGPKGK